MGGPQIVELLKDSRPPCHPESGFTIQALGRIRPAAAPLMGGTWLLVQGNIPRRSDSASNGSGGTFSWLTIEADTRLDSPLQ